MIRSHTLRKRDLYLDKLIAFQDTEPIKVVTGIRRCGKSSLLKLMAAHLRGNGVSDEQIIEMNFESYEFLKMTADELYRYVKERVLPDRRIYLFFDELQRMDGWENAVNSFRVDFDCDIYITGSNAYLLSSEYSTYLSGRCVEIKMLPLSFAEFVDFYGFTIKTVKSALGGQKKKAVDQDGTQYELREIFDAYMRFGGMPGIADVGMEQTVSNYLLELVRATRGEARLALGASPRAALVLAETARTAALLAGRDYVLPDEVRDLARVVLPHRLVLDSRSRYSGVTAAEIVEDLLGKIKIPR